MQRKSISTYCDIHATNTNTTTAAAASVTVARHSAGASSESQTYQRTVANCTFLLNQSGKHNKLPKICE